MKKTKHLKDIQEITDLKNWCIVVADFLQSISKHTLFAEWCREIEHDNDLTNLPSWRMAYDTLLAAVLDIEPQHYKRLNAILKEKFGKDLNLLNSKLQQKIGNIIQRNKIRNEEEYYLLREHYERVWDEQPYASQTEIIQKMLFSYEQKK